MEQAKRFFWDEGRKFDALKGDIPYASDKNLTIFSLTPKGQKKPSRLIIRLTPADNPDGWRTSRRMDVKEANVTLLTMDYQAFSPDQAVSLCSGAARWLPLKLAKEGFVTLLRAVPGEKPKTARASVREFFAIDPCEDGLGAKEFLRDKAVFLSRLPDPARPDFSALPLLTDAEKAKVTEIRMQDADVSGRRYLDGLFKGFARLQKLDLSGMDTTGAVSLQDLFWGCASLRQLDLSAMDFSRVTNLRSMLAGCDALETVLLSDSILDAGNVPHAEKGYTVQQINAIGRHEYITSGPELAAMAMERAARDPSPMICGPFRNATMDEVRKHLGLKDNVEIRVVPHRKRR